MTSLYLQRAGFLVSLCHDTTEARKVLQASHFDAIISDIGLPGENGLDFCKWLHSQKKYEKMPVILISGHATGFDQDVLKPCGAFMSKPVFFPNLIGKLEEFLKNGID